MLIKVAILIVAYSMIFTVRLFSNTPPTANFKTSPPSSIVNEAITVDASFSSDAEDSIDKLRVRWDWENDGIWDTEYSTTKIATHAYTAAGEYIIKLEVVDTGGLKNVVAKRFLVDEPYLWSIGIFTDTHARRQNPATPLYGLIQPFYALHNMRMILHCGDADFTYIDDPMTKWLFDLVKLQSPAADLLLAPGNHDNDGRMDEAWRVAAVCGKYPLSNGNFEDGPIWNREISDVESWKTGVEPLRYYVKRGGLRVIVLDCWPSEEEKIWLRNFITQPDDSSVTICIKHVDDFNYLYSCFEGLEGQHNVKLFFVGHGHNYQHYEKYGVHFIEGNGLAHWSAGDYNDAMRILVYRDKIHVDRLPMRLGATIPETWERLLTIPGEFKEYVSVPTVACDTVPPTTPTILFPADGSIFTSFPIVLDWEDVFDSTVTCKYELQLCSREDFISPEIEEDGLEKSEYSINYLPNGVYWWRVRAKNYAWRWNISDWAGPRKVVVVTREPIPSDGVSISTISVAPARISRAQQFSVGVPVKMVVSNESGEEFYVESAGLIFSQGANNNVSQYYEVLPHDSNPLIIKSNVRGEKFYFTVLVSSEAPLGRTEVDGYISGYKNMIPNGSFEEGDAVPPVYWDFWVSGPHGKCVIDTAVFSHGKRSLKLSLSSAYSEEYLTITNVRYIPVEPSMSYEISLWYRNDHTEKIISYKVVLEEYDTARSKLSEQSIYLLPTNKWVYVKREFVTRNDSAYVRVKVYMQAKEGNISGNFWLDMLAMRKKGPLLRVGDNEGDVKGWWEVVEEIDNFSPAAITDLKVELEKNRNAVMLCWTSPGDDGYTGVATEYDIRYSSMEVSIWDFGVRLSSFIDLPEPAASGNYQSCVIPYSLGLFLQETTYYFAIRARDEVNNWSDISNVAAVYIRGGVLEDDISPPPPSLISPAHGAAVASFPISFDWVDVTDKDTGNSDPCKYDFQIDDSYDFTSPEVFVEGLSMSSYTIRELRAGEYWWRVRSKDAHGNKSEWSVAWRVVVPQAFILDVIDGGFEATTLTPGSTSWSLHRNLPETTQISIDESVAYQGLRSARITCSIPDNAYLLQEVRISKGKERYYKFRVWMKTSGVQKYSGSHGASLHILWLGEKEKNYPLYGEDWLDGPVGTTDWTKVEGVFLAPAEATTARIMLVLHFSTGTVWFDNINVEDDTTPPASVMDLDVEARFINNVPRVVLRWTAPGDDGTVGDIVGGKYRIDYADYDRLDGWNKENYRVEFATGIIRAGSVMSYEVEGDFVEGKRYYFCVWVMDDAGNWSGRSNIASCAVPFRAPASNKIVVKPNIVVSSVGADDKVVLQYHVFTPGKVSIKVYSLSGELVKEFDEGHKERGVYEKIWEGLRLELRSSGVYFIQYTVGETKKNTKFIYVK